MVKCLQEMEGRRCICEAGTAVTKTVALFIICLGYNAELIFKLK